MTKDKKQEIIYKECLEFALFEATIFVEVSSLKTALKRTCNIYVFA